MPLDLEALTLISDIEYALSIGTTFATLKGAPLTSAREIIDALLRDGTINLQEPPTLLKDPPLRSLSPPELLPGMYRVKAKLAKLSICECGFGLMNDDIPLGKVYTAFPQTRRKTGRFGCGRCGREYDNVDVVLVDHRSGIPGWLPSEMFEFDEAVTTEILFLSEEKMGDFFVNGIVSTRDGHPYIQLSNEKGMIAQLSMGQARQIANDIYLMCSRTEADAMLIKFFEKTKLPLNALGALLQDFRDFRHELDMEKVEHSDQPGEPL